VLSERVARWWNRQLRWPDSDSGPSGESSGRDICSEAEGILAVENAPLPLVVVLPDGQVAVANRALRELLGYSSDDLAGLHVLDLVADPHVAVACWAEWLAAGGAPDHAVDLRHRNGATIAARSAWIVVYGDDGETRMVIGHARAV
jgi:PAS domain S-box-containing protein